MKDNLRQFHILFETLPYSELYSNKKRTNFWAKTAEVSATAREEGYLKGKRLGIKIPLEYYDLEIIFTVPDKRKRDYMGMLEACKNWVDSLIVPPIPKSIKSKNIIGAGIIMDDDIWHMRRLSVSMKYEKGEEGTEFIITELKEEK